MGADSIARLVAQAKSTADIQQRAHPDALARAIEAGLQIHDLAEVGQRRTIGQQLQADSSLAWCRLALDWKATTALGMTGQIGLPNNQQEPALKSLVTCRRR